MSTQTTVTATPETLVEEDEAFVTLTWLWWNCRYVFWLHFASNYLMLIPRIFALPGIVEITDKLP